MREEFTNNIMAYNENNESHLEIYRTDMECDRRNFDHHQDDNRCKSKKGVGVYQATGDESDLPVCLNCLIDEKVFEEMNCDKCKGLIFTKYDEKIGLEGCECINPKKKLKEKPILECQWVRVRDYQ